MERAVKHEAEHAPILLRSLVASNVKDVWRMEDRVWIQSIAQFMGAGVTGATGQAATCLVVLEQEHVTGSATRPNLSMVADRVTKKKDWILNTAGNKNVEKNPQVNPPAPETAGKVAIDLDPARRDLRPVDGSKRPGAMMRTIE